jgi:hypothetical protein
VWIWGVPGIGKSVWAAPHSQSQQTLRKNFGKWWDGYSLILTTRVVIDNYPRRPGGSRAAAELKKWGDRYAFLGDIKGSHVFVDLGRFTLVIASNWSIDDTFREEGDRQALKDRFHEVEITPDNREQIFQWSLDRSVLRH